MFYLFLISFVGKKTENGYKDDFAELIYHINYVNDETETLKKLMKTHLILTVSIILMLSQIINGQMAYHDYNKTGRSPICNSANQGSFDSLQIISPERVPTMGKIPIIIKVLDTDKNLEKYFSDELDVLSTIALNPDKVNINCGAGGFVSEYACEQNFSISILGFTKNIDVLQEWPIVLHSGELTNSEVWENSSIHHITGDIFVNDTAILTIAHGCRIIVNQDVNIWVYGEIKVEGSTDAPVLFTAADPGNSWGGIRIISQENESSISNAIFTDGGGNDEFIFGHSSSQPVVFIYFSLIKLTNCYFIQNEGKAVGGTNSKISINNCIMNKCDMGGEFHSCYVEVEQSHFSEMPDGDGLVMDDDNDGLYFHRFLPSMGDQLSVVNNCVFTKGEDDGIDHNKAKLSVTNCLISGFFREGIAASEGNFVNIYNCVISDCEQGIEAGYGYPLVKVDHCVVLNNNIGIRFGDSYFTGSYGHIDIQNSICYNNQDNFLNFDLLVQDSVANAISASYTMTNDNHYNQYPFCIEATPVFLPGYYLSPGSPGVSQAADGCDMGLYRCNTGIGDELISETYYSVYPNPCDGILYICPKNCSVEEVRIKVINLNGKTLIDKLVVLKNGVFEIDLLNYKLRERIVLLNISNSANINGWYKIILSTEKL